jgi:hypothetical protein
MCGERTKTIVLMSFVFLFSLACRLGFSQAITGDILGTIQDASGAIVPSAKVTLTEVNKGLKLEATSDDSGNYLFAQLRPGHYSVQASKEGFETTTVSDIELLVGQRPRVDLTLRVGAVSQKIEVTAGGVQQLDTQTSSLGQVVSDEPIVGLPLNGRSFTQLMYISAGVVPPGISNASAASTWEGQSNLTASVAGMRESNESFLVDGIETRNARFGAVGLRPSIDAIQEFKMQTDAFSAQFGRSSAVVNTTLKSGSNSIHGSAYEFIRNNSLDAQSFFLNLSATPLTEFRQNDFGFSLGGPVVLPPVYHGRDKTFFFINYEGIRSRQGASNTGLVPSAAQWGGDLADDSAGTGIYPTDSTFCTSSPTSSKCHDVIDPTTGVAFPGNVIPKTRLDPVAQKWLSYIVAPNVAVPAGGINVPLFNVENSPVIRNDMNQGISRMDHSISSKDQLFGSYSFEDRPHFVPGLMPTQGSAFPFRNQLLAITEAHVFAPTVVNEARFGYNRSKTYLIGLGANGPNYASTVFGLANTSGNPFDYGVPDAGITGFTGPGSFAESIGALDEYYQATDNLSIVKGRNDYKLGITLMHEKFFEITDFGGVPNFSFNGTFTGTGLGDFLLGDPYSGTTAIGDSHQNLRGNYWAGYLLDDMRVKPSLTLNLGLRYEHSQTPYDTQDRSQWFDPILGKSITSASGGVRNGIVDPDWNNFAPRIGFAYSPKFLPNTVIRSAYGIFYGTDNWNELQMLVYGPAFYVAETLYSSVTKPTLTLENLFPAGALTGGSGTDPNSIDKRNRTPYVQEWNFGIQHTFAKDWLLDVSYMGNTGQKLPLRLDENLPTPDPTGTIPYTSRLRYPNYGWIELDYGGGWSSYNGLLTKVEKRFSNGMYFLATYTYSHAIDLGSTDDVSTWDGIRTLQKGNGTYDQRHRLVLSYIYELPVGHGKHFASGTSGAVDRLIAGWKFTGITTFSTGQFQTPGLPVNWPVDGTFANDSRPNQIGNPYPANHSYLNWTNVSAYTYPGCPSYTPCSPGLHVQGNAGRDSIEQPGMNNWDFALMKDTRLHEKRMLEFRAEFFNGWNHTQFGPSNTDLVPGQFGRISSLLVSPREIQLGLKFIW